MAGAHALFSQPSSQGSTSSPKLRISALLGPDRSGRTSEAFREAFRVAEELSSSSSAAAAAAPVFFLCSRSKLEASPPWLGSEALPATLGRIVFFYVETGRDLLRFLARLHLLEQGVPSLVVVDDFDRLIDSGGGHMQRLERHKLAAHACALMAHAATAGVAAFDGATASGSGGAGGAGGDIAKPNGATPPRCLRRVRFLIVDQLMSFTSSSFGQPGFDDGSGGGGGDNGGMVDLVDLPEHLAACSRWIDCFRIMDSPATAAGAAAAVAGGGGGGGGGIGAADPKAVWGSRGVRPA